MRVIDSKIELRALRMLVSAMNLLEIDKLAQVRAMEYLTARYAEMWTDESPSSSADTAILEDAKNG